MKLKNSCSKLHFQKGVNLVPFSDKILDYAGGGECLRGVAALNAGNEQVIEGFDVCEADEERRIYLKICMD